MLVSTFGIVRLSMLCSQFDSDPQKPNSCRVFKGCLMCLVYVVTVSGHIPHGVPLIWRKDQLAFLRSSNYSVTIILVDLGISVGECHLEYFSAINKYPPVRVQFVSY